MTSWILAARPKTLPAAVVPVWVGLVLSWWAGGKIDWLLAATTLGAALAIQIATNLFNDGIDARKGADTAKRLGPVRATASGLLSSRAVFGGAIFFLLLAAAAGGVLIEARGWGLAGLGVICLYLCYGYTGGPWPLAYKGLGELFVILFFGFVAVGGTVFIQLGTVPPAAWLLGLQIGCLSAVLIAVNNYRDREEDAGSGKKTLAVRFGLRFARLSIGVFVLLPYVLIPLGVLWNLPVMAWGFASLLPLVVGLRVLSSLEKSDGPGLNRLLALSALQLVLFAATFHVAVAFAG